MWKSTCYWCYCNIKSTTVTKKESKWQANGQLEKSLKGNINLIYALPIVVSLQLPLSKHMWQWACSDIVFWQWLSGCIFTFAEGSMCPYHMQACFWLDIIYEVVGLIYMGWWAWYIYIYRGGGLEIYMGWWAWYAWGGGLDIHGVVGWIYMGWWTGHACGGGGLDMHG